MARKRRPEPTTTSGHEAGALSNGFSAELRTEDAARLAQFAFDHAGEGVVWIGSDARFLYVNETFCRSLGYSAEELLSLSVGDIDPDFPVEQWPEHWKELKREGVLRFESRHRTKDGRIFPVEITAKYLEFDGKEYNCAFAREITDRKRVEEALRESEERYDLAVQGANDGLWDWPDVTKEKEWWSPRWYELLGYEVGELPACFTSFKALLHPDDLPKMLEDLEAHFQEHAPFDTEYRLKTKSGEYRWFRGRGQALWDETSQPTRMSGSIQDIHDRKLAEAALKTSEQQFRTLVENIPSMVYRCGLKPPRHVRYVSEAVLAITGYPAGEFIDGEPRNFGELILPEDAGGVVLAVDRGIASGEPYELEYRIRHADGSIRWVSEKGRAVYDAQGEALWLDGVITDITEHKRAEEEFRQQAQLNQILLDSLPPVTLLLKPRTREIVACNRTGKEVGAIPGAVCFRTWGRSDRPCPWCLAEKAWRTGEPQHLQTWGMGRYWDAHWIPITDELYLHYALDITESKEAEEELARAKIAAEAASRAKSEFLANMSHEIRTPMTAIMGFTDLLMSLELPVAERREYLGTIHRNAEHLLQIINDILDLSKIEAEKLQLEQADCSPWQILEDVRSLMSVRAKEKQLNLEIEHTFPLPASIRTDPIRLRQILVNLVANAIKFTERGKVTMAVRFPQQEDTPPWIEFEVSDTGIGMSEDEIGHLFTPFTQGDMSTTRRFGGTGLGLSISRRLAEALGGQITVASELGRGSTFCVAIDPGPLENVRLLDELPSDLVDGEEPAVLRKDTGLRGRVLLAEDAPEVRTLLGLMLKAWGLDVDFASNGKVAVEKVLAPGVTGQQYDAILMDIQMPEMDGFEATQRLRQGGCQTPILALTAHAMADDRQRCLDAGCNDYVSKPIDCDQLFGSLSLHLGGEHTAGSSAEEPHPPGDLAAEKVALMAEFLKELPGRAAEFSAALDAQDWDQLALLAHRMKGTAAIYELPSISQAARQLEQLAKDADLTRIEPVVAELTSLCRQVVEDGH